MGGLSVDAQAGCRVVRGFGCIVGLLVGSWLNTPFDTPPVGRSVVVWMVGLLLSLSFRPEWE